ncbi:MAG: radical SAM protein [Parcubacteria group bacterium]
MYRDCKMNIKNSTKKVVFELTTACNLNCKHCFYQNNEEFNSSHFLKKQQAFILIDKFKKNGINKLVLTGGEPTIHPDFVEIAKYAKYRIKKVTLCTNGVIKNKNLIENIINLNFDTYTVSIDSHLSNIHNSFRGKEGALREVLTFTELLKKNNRNLSIHITLHQNNINHIEKTINFCRKFNCEIVVSSIYYEKVAINDKIKEDYQEKIKDFKNKYINDKKVILVGFNKYCNAKNCLDQKQVYTVNSYGQLVGCYWKKGGGKVIKKY